MGALRRFRDEERGATAAVVGVSLIALFGALLLSVDAGNMWRARRTVITATDASAFQEARAAALFGPELACTTSDWKTALIDNAGPDVEPEACVVSGDSGSGFVRVEARLPYEVRFGGVLGIENDKSAYSMSAAMYGYITQAAGLRPIGVCVEHPSIQAWLNGTYDGSVQRIHFNKQSPDDCGDGVPGNWGWQDFNGGNNSNSEMRQWLLNGYKAKVGVNDCDADGNPGDMCEGDTGSRGESVIDALQHLVDSGETFGITIYDVAVESGANAQFNTWGFLGVKIHGYRVGGAEKNRYFDFTFHNIVLSGNCCSPTGVETGAKGVRLCGVDHDPLDPTTEAARCDMS